MSKKQSYDFGVPEEFQYTKKTKYETDSIQEDFTDLLEDDDKNFEDENLRNFVISIVEEYLQNRYEQCDALVVQEYLTNMAKAEKKPLKKSYCFPNK